jgi:16S rRNA A1518/A1519 N6-dimethyltransferase RsmA/KsgA/DIM1 with predicted DNA glycosylase/AP lyase activity
MGVLLYVLIVIASAVCAYLLGLLNGALYIPTDRETLERMLAAAKLAPGDRLVDIGSGDGRLVIAAARMGIEAMGYEINPLLVWLSRGKIRKERLEMSARIIWKDFWNADLSSYSVVTVFGIAHIMRRLERKLDAELAPGTRVVCNLFPLPNWEGEKGDGVFVYTKK